MKILITGGAGFIGSHLAERHLALGDEVYIIDDLSTGSISNIQHLKIHPQFSYHIESVNNTHLMAELVDLSDVIYHLAAAVGVRLILDSPVRTIETNIRGTEIVLSLAVTKRKRVLIASSSEVYGKKEQVPFREDDDLVLGATSKARWSYACSKAIDEFLAIAYWKEHRVPTVIARMFNTVGPRQTGRYGMVIPNFVAQAISGTDIRVFGDGTQSRCFTHVTDAVDALVGIAAHPDANGEVYNVGGNHEITIMELAERIRKMTKSKSRIVTVPYSTAYEEGFEDMQRRVPDVGKLNRLIGYEPKISLEDSLQSIIEDQRARLRGTGVLTFA
ncbi:MAG TPA: GDP-mannose 4,6-dehydratase [Terriglobales bacterium]